MASSENAIPASATATLVVVDDGPEVDPFSIQKQSKKYVLLSIFVLAQFMDVASNSMLFPAVPQIAADLEMTGTQPSWIFAAYSATFAAFLLISGRCADIYTPKPVFIGGNIALGCFALGTGFVRKKVPFLILRAFSGIGAAFTIPAAYQMIVRLFPDPNEQGLAMAAFGSTVAIANMGGLILGGTFTQLASWHWIFWSIAIIALTIAISCVLIIPNVPRPAVRLPIDMVGVATIAAALILFIFAVTQGSNNSWGTAGVIAPLVISIFVFIAFFTYEWWIDENKAALPPKMWFYDNFSVLFGVGLFPFFWWVSVMFLFTSWWEDKLHYTDVDTSVRFLVLGIPSIFVAIGVSKLAEKIPSKKLVIAGELLVMAGTLFFPFGDQRNRYWSILMPGMLLGTIGSMSLYVIASIAFFQTTPPEVAGTVGAVFNCALQLGGALGVACITSIQTSVDRKHPTKLNGYAGRAAAFWFILALVSILFIATLVFYKTVRPKGDIEKGAIIEVVEAKEHQLGTPESKEDKDIKLGL